MLSRCSRRARSGCVRRSARSCAAPRSSSASTPTTAARRWRAASAPTSRRYQGGDPVAEIKALTDGRGADVAIEALGRQETFENALRSIRPGGTLSSLGVYSGKLVAPYEAVYAGLGDQKIVTTLCPGGKERMRRLMAMVEHRRVDLAPLVTHQFALDDIAEAYELFSQQRDGVMKVALYPAGVPQSAALATAGAVDRECSRPGQASPVLPSRRTRHRARRDRGRLSRDHQAVLSELRQYGG